MFNMQYAIARTVLIACEHLIYGSVILLTIYLLENYY